MSRTDVHAPLWVRVYRREVAAEADHDHRDGVCDLPEHADPDWYRVDGDRCGWVPAYPAVWKCSCDLCRDKVGHRLDLRRERRSAAAHLVRARGQWERGYRSALDDVVVPHRNCHWW